MDLANGSGSKCKEIDKLYCLVDLETETWHMRYSHEDMSLNIFLVNGPQTLGYGGLETGTRATKGINIIFMAKVDNNIISRIPRNHLGPEIGLPPEVGRPGVLPQPRELAKAS